ncbi:hypothetical protein I7I50_12116 [Histoplasma capsulatum G186AR]|uniref:Uncharacterized protein n=1 Tax=Ajellomyces capsulatus TaxID=5037 RepID=A0A8H7YB11_AJECA|nr:hypothetical protein I7I52_11572 [Histoplasma capsulatum]QSS70475.1 hypothetical protein I7I50_12116 [Histoplasma capsulatum G186AR]
MCICLGTRLDLGEEYPGDFLSKCLMILCYRCRSKEGAGYLERQTEKRKLSKPYGFTVDIRYD